MPKLGTLYTYEFHEQKKAKNSRGVEKNYSGSNSENHAVFTFSWQRNQNGHEASVYFKEAKQKTTVWPDSLNNLEFNSPNDPYQKGLDVFKSTSFTLQISRNDSLSIIRGYNNFKTKIDSLYGNNSSALPGDIPTVFSKSYLEHFFQRIIQVLPNNFLSIGYSWKKNDFANTTDPIETKVNCIVTGINAGIVHIKTTFEINQTLKYSNSSMLLTGKGDGFIELEASTGVLLRMKNSISAGGKMTLGAIDLNTEMEYHTEINLISN